MVGDEGDAVLDDEERGAGGKLGFKMRRLDEQRFDFMYGHADEDADVALVFETGEDFRPREIGGFFDAKGDERGASGMGRERFLPNRRRVVVDDGLAGSGVVTRSNLREPNFKKIGELRHRADGGAGCFDGVGLLDGDRRADVFDGIDFGFV